MTDQLVEKAALTIQRHRTPEEIIERGLMAVALHNGNASAAQRFLAKDGIEVSSGTLLIWSRRQHIERYQELRQTVLPKIRAKAADEHMDLAERQMEVNRKILARLGESVEALPVKELPGASRNMSVGAAVETEKAQLLNDQPTERRAFDLPGTLKELKSFGVEPERILDVEIVDEEDLSNGTT